jgi:ferredoxin
MRIRIDAELCVGHGRCAAAAPDVFALDAEGYNSDRGRVREIAPEHIESARRAIRMCPEGAITVPSS